MDRPIVALVYDFDKTLSPKDMQEYSFLPGINMRAEAFWGLCRELAIRSKMDGILAYMYMMQKAAPSGPRPPSTIPQRRSTCSASTRAYST